MNKELKNGLIAALVNKASANFSSEDVNEAAVNAIMAECGITAESSAREIREAEPKAFALIEEAVDEILPKKLKQCSANSLKSAPSHAMLKLSSTSKNLATNVLSSQFPTAHAVVSIVQPV